MTASETQSGTRARETQIALGLLAHVDAVNCAKKPVLLFGSYGWSGEACGNLKSRVEGLKMKVWEELFKVNFVPSEADLEKARNLGRDFAASLA